MLPVGHDFLKSKTRISHRMTDAIGPCGRRLFNRALLLFAFVLLANPVTAQTHRHRPALATTPVLDANGALWVAGVNATGQLFLQRQLKDTTTWEPPRLIDTGNDRVMADGQNRPKLVFLKDGRWLITYTTPLAKPYTGDVKFMLSADGGRTFTPPRRVHEDSQVITHRFESVITLHDGSAQIFWIDKRDMESNKLNGRPYRGAAIYRSVLKPGADLFSGDIKVADHSCECCQIAATPLRDGDALVMWRHVFEPNIRDHAIARIAHNSAAAIRTNQASVPTSVPTGPTLHRATFDNWAIDACPHQGPALTQAADNSLHAVWFGIRQGKPDVRYVRFNDEAHITDSTETLPGDGAEFADIISTAKRVWIVWRQFDGKVWRLMAREGLPDGTRLRIHTMSESDTDNDIPRLFVRQGKASVVWRQTDEIRIIELPEQGS